MDRQQEKKMYDALTNADEWLKRSVTELDYIARHDGVSTSSLLEDCTATTRHLFAVRSVHQQQLRYRDNLLRAVARYNELLQESWELSEELQRTLDAYLNSKRND